MMDRNRHKKITKQFADLKSNLEDKKVEYLEQISSIINKAVKNQNDKELWNNSYDKIVDIFYNALTETYLLTAITLKNIYEHISDKIPNIEDFFYKEDNKTLSDRIKDYWNDGKNLLKKSPDNMQDIALHLLTMYDRILTTEMQNVKTGVKKTKKPLDNNNGIEVIYVTDGECCEYGGIYLAEDDPPIPPFHPNCQCDWWFDFYYPSDEQDLEVLQEAGWEEDDE